MSKNTGNTNKTTNNWGGTLPTCCFEEIETPGAYLEVQTGRLYRLTSDSILPGHSPIFSMVSKEPTTFVLLCDDPSIPISKARLIASNNDYWPNF